MPASVLCLWGSRVCGCETEPPGAVFLQSAQAVPHLGVMCADLSHLALTPYPSPPPRIPGCRVNSGFYTRGNFLSLEVVMAEWLKMCSVASLGISQWCAAAFEFLKTTFFFLNEAWRRLFQIGTWCCLPRTPCRSI